MIPPHLDFKRLKRGVSIEQVLADKGLLDRLSKRGDRLLGPCPIHGGDNPTAFVVDRSKNLWHCFTGCRTGGDVVELARRLQGGGYIKAARYLASLAGSGFVPSPTSIDKRPRRPFRPFTRRLRLDPSADFLARKGIAPQTARRFDVGAYHGPGMLAGCLAVRLHDANGRPLGYAGRRLDPNDANKRGKWVFPHRLPKSTLLYGYHQAAAFLHRGAVVVESPWSVLRLAQLNLPAVALLGTTLSPHQRALLAHLPRLILLLDGDPAGRRATSKIATRLPQATVIDLPSGRDPDDLSDRELATTVATQPLLPS